MRKLIALILLSAISTPAQAQIGGRASQGVHRSGGGIADGAGDTAGPAVSITSPADSATVAGTTPVTAAADDNVGVVGVQFKLDGANLGGVDLAAPFSISWDTTTASEGSHSLTAVARDAAGNTTTSAPLAVTVSNGGPGAGTYEAVTHRETMPEPAFYPAPSAAGQSITDPQFGTTILRVTDTGTEASGISYHTTSAAEHATWSADSSKFYVVNSGGATLPFAVDASGNVTRYSSTANSPGALGRQLKFQSEPIFSLENSNLMYGAGARAGDDNHTVIKYDFSNDSYSTILDLDSLGFDLTDNSATRQGQYVGYISSSFAQPGERIAALFGGISQDAHYLIAVMSQSGAVAKVIDTKNKLVGTNSSNMVALPPTSAFDAAASGTVTINATTSVAGVGTQFLSEMIPGQTVRVNGQDRVIDAITDQTHLTVKSAFTGSAAGQTIQTIGACLHNATLSRDGRYLIISNSIGTHHDPNARVIYDLNSDIATKITYKGGGHVAAGFGDLLNQEYTNDAAAWYRRPLSDPNTPASVVLLNEQRCLSGCDTANEDHTSWLTSTPTNRRAVALMDEYAYGADAYPPNQRAWWPWFQEIIGVQTGVTAPQTAAVYRFCHHMSDVRSEARGLLSGGVLPGATSITLSGDVSAFAPGGNATIGLANAAQEHITYASKSGNTLTGIPAAGPGSITLPHGSGTHVTQPGTLSFWYTPRVQVAPNGKWAIFTSNWKKTLGSPGSPEPGENYREDVFLVKLPTSAAPAPNVSNVAIGSITSSGATITFDTSALGDSAVEYSTDLSYGSSKKDYTLKTGGHSITLTGLSPGTTYNIRVKSRNRGAVGATQTGSFTTS